MRGWWDTGPGSWRVLVRSLEEPGQPADSGRLKDPDQRQFDPQPVPDAGHQTGGQQGVPTEEEEVLVEPHRPLFQQDLPDVLESGVHGVRVIPVSR